MKNKIKLISLIMAISFITSSTNFAYYSNDKDPMLEQIISDCKKKEDFDCVNIFQRGQDIHLCQATKSFTTENGSFVEAMSEEEVKEWIYYNHLYPKNCRYY